MLNPGSNFRLSDAKSRLLSYQPPSVDSLVAALEKHNGAFDGSDTGTGKSYVVTAAASVLQRPLFVVCPKPVKPAWRRVALHFRHYVDTHNYEQLRLGNVPRIVEYAEGKRLHWNLPKDWIIVFDECHRLNDPDSWNCELGLAALRQNYTVVGLSATPADNPAQMKFLGLLCKLFPSENDYPEWTKAHQCEMKWDKEQFVGTLSTMQKLHEQVFPEHGTRLRISDLGDAFPKTQITAECYDIGQNHSRANTIYLEMEKELKELKEKQKGDSEKAALTTMLRARQKTEILKVPALVEMVDDAMEQGLSVAVFVNFNDTLDALAERLGTDCLIRGGQSEEERQFNIDRFQSLTGPRLSILCPTFSAKDLVQGLGRVHRDAAEDEQVPESPKPSRLLLANLRAGGTGIGLHDLLRSKSLQRIFFASGTIEETACERVRQKVGRINTLNDGDLAIGAESLWIKRVETMEPPPLLRQPPIICAPPIIMSVPPIIKDWRK